MDASDALDGNVVIAAVIPMSSRAPARSATLHDVAREAGVSLITASRALGNPAGVSKATIARVREAADRTGYIPNLLAQGARAVAAAGRAGGRDLGPER